MAEEQVRVMRDVRSPQPVVAGFEDRGRGPPAKEYGRPLEADKGKEMNCPLESFLQKGTHPVNIFTLPSETHIVHITKFVVIY